MQKINVFWFRRDLRLKDNHGLFQALKDENPVLPIFIFDENILSQLENKSDKRVDFIFQVLEILNSFLNEKQTGIQYFYGKPLDVFQQISEQYQVEKVFNNEDYEPYARKRDAEILSFLNSKQIEFHSYKDQVIFAKDEVVKADGLPYTVYTPYSKKWLQNLKQENYQPFPSEKFLDNLLKFQPENFGLEHIGFQKTDYEFQKPEINFNLIKNYDQTRNIPFIKGTSELSVHLRFGTIGIRTLVSKIKDVKPTFLKELIWREFFMQILWHFPKSAKHCFKEKYENIAWDNNEDNFRKWCEGKTGFPIVDAGMRQLNATGFMHNRVRMITASFLIKDLLIDWRWGEAYFAEKLMDYDQAQNVGNWQWAAGSGCDAAPYFRIFNPDEQQKKFDPELKYIKKWLPEFGTPNYPKPMVNHKEARLRTLEAYKKAVK